MYRMNLFNLLIFIDCQGSSLFFITRSNESNCNTNNNTKHMNLWQMANAQCLLILTCFHNLH